ncbi:D-2-hydroxyacid dehydrogenase [Exilibacterium tricleocarpae]|uniref:D-2-hydroxyacid dehydrogenase n=1 Tax=Exilibacterium tricleocarpae TaxID=2591008 RepID=A0A545TAL7_9GAMM|nr:D-2-hydroxyacid dehydrogenase [Exilibacterium tricleocarpae]TQV74256.1 D-2-hydroxyacid dehydrogenase [Exilibacterium tricleocarpae]
MALRGVILDCDSLGPDDLDLTPLLGTLPSWQRYPVTAAAQVAGRISDADVVVTNKVVLDAALLVQAPRLKLVCVAATGTNNIDVAAAHRQGICVTNVAGYGVGSVAQHTLTLMLSLATQLPRYAAAVERGDWCRSPFFCLLDYPIVELADKALGIVGYGAIGQAVAKLARALGMRVLVSARPGAEVPVPGRLPFAQVLADADVVSLHCPLTETTAQLINAETLAQMRPGAFLINTARGGLIDESALAAALKRRALAGAALDSISVEPPPADHPMLAGDIPNLLLTPHCAWGSQPARQRLVGELANNIEAFKQGTPRNLVLP